jgi:hypothetical protein
MTKYGQLMLSGLLSTLLHKSPLQGLYGHGHLPEADVECLEDFDTEQEAVEFSQRLLSLFPNFRKYGLIMC